MATGGQIQPDGSIEPKIDVAKALVLRLTRGLTLQEIADKFGVTKQAVHGALARFDNLLKNNDIRPTYQANKASVLENIQVEILSNMVDPARLEKASVNNLAYAAGQLDNMIRLERGQSTANIQTYDATQDRLDKLRAERQALETELGIIITTEADVTEADEGRSMG